MDVKLLGHTKLSDEFINTLNDQLQEDLYYNKISDGQVIALSAIRTCYSHNHPSEIAELEGDKYFNKVARDGEGGTEADRLIRHIMNSGHTSTMEHVNFTFSIEGVSRSLLAQLTRHRHFSYSVQSQRYNKLETTSKSGGFDFVTPESIKEHDQTLDMYNIAMERIQEIYDDLRKYGIPAEDARMILPNAATCNLVLTGNLRSILEFYGKRNPSTHAQNEIAQLADKIKDVVIKVEPWTESFFKIDNN
jgi:thymidylate synthase (FAD)